MRGFWAIGGVLVVIFATPAAAKEPAAPRQPRMQQVPAGPAVLGCDPPPRCEGPDAREARRCRAQQVPRSCGSATAQTTVDVPASR